jgi:hypothetical protein
MGAAPAKELVVAIEAGDTSANPLPDAATGIPRIIHRTAPSKSLTWEERRIDRAARRMMPTWEHRLWDDADNAALLRRHLPHYADRYDAIPFGVARSDVARYVYMHAMGGFYLDTDYRLFRPLDAAVLQAPCIIPLEGADPQNEPAWPGYLGLGNAIMGSQPGHPFWLALLTHIFEVGRPDTLRRREEVIPVTGPEAVTRFYLANADRFADIALPEKNLFYPTMYRLGTRTSAGPDTYGVHLHWGAWRNKSLEVAVKTLVRRKLNGLISR